MNNNLMHQITEATLVNGNRDSTGRLAFLLVLGHA